MPIILLTGLSVAFLVLGMMQKKISNEHVNEIDRVMAYTEDFSQDQEDGKRLSLFSRKRRYKIAVKSGRIEKFRLEVLRADLPLTGEEWFLIRLMVPVFMGVGTAVLKTSVVFGIMGLGAGMLGMKLFIAYRIQKRLKVFTGQLNDALGIMSNSLRAGYSFLQSVSSVSREMPAPISSEFGRLLKELSLGQDTDVALRNLSTRVQSDDLELIVRAILIQKETGGNLAEILDTISTTIRDRIKIQGEIKTMTAQGRMSGMVVGLMPVALIGIMYALNPSYISVLFTHPLGRVMLGVAFVSEVVGMLLIRKIVSIEV